MKSYNEQLSSTPIYSMFMHQKITYSPTRLGSDNVDSWSGFARASAEYIII